MAGVLPLPDSPLVEADWLAEHLNAVIVLDCSIAREQTPQGQTRYVSGVALFLQQHIPSARFADLTSDFSHASGAFPFTCPTAEALSAALQAAGVNRRDTIVVYDQLNGAWAARVWYLLTVVFDFPAVRCLNGGLNAWQSAGGLLASGASAEIAPGDAQVSLVNSHALLSTGQVVALAKRAPDRQRPLLCALRETQYSGEEGSDPRSGHIPGSFSLPYPALLDGAGRIDPDRVESAFQMLELTADSEPVLYCGGGINAAGLALALVAAGFPAKQLTLYDDSLNGWLHEPSLPTLRGAAPGRWPAGLN